MMLALALTLAATTVEPLTAEQLAERSDVVARVVVTAERAERVGRRVVTFYEVDLVDTWRATVAAAGADDVTARKLTVAVLGGVVDGIGQHVAGMPRLKVGQGYVLCLGAGNGPMGARGIVGLWQGAFTVVDAARLLPFTHDGAVDVGAGGVGAVDMSALRARMAR